MYLERIVHTKHKEVDELKQTFNTQQAERVISAMEGCKGFADALTARKHRAMGLISEVKKASPSKGLIREDFHPVALAEAYVAAGADCLSVLTDRDYFQGANDYLSRIREAVNVPLLRKDFTIDYRQVYEARMIGADAVLLIAAILSPQQMKELLTISDDLGMDTLVEVHDRQELEQVLELDAKLKLIGINNRNLKTFVTDLSTTEQLAKLIPTEYTIVSESGISKPEEIAYLASIGAEAVLIGEHFMRQPDVGEAIHQLMGEPVL